VKEIPLSCIRIVNPRSRSKRQHQSIIDNIAVVGLKRPITVCRRANSKDEELYDLVCGQGRLEAVQKLGNHSIPAIVVERSEEDCLVMSLVENVARRNHSTHELLEDIRSLLRSGYTDATIAGKVGLSLPYLQSLLLLLDQGEGRLVDAVENGTIPVALAISIARADDAEVQRALADAYTEGALRGRQLAIVRRLIERRSVAGRAAPPHGKHVAPRPRLGPEQLRRMYVRESERQRLLVKKVEVTHARLLFIVQALRKLAADGEFVVLLRQEGFTTIPRLLERRINGEAQSWEH